MSKRYTDIDALIVMLRNNIDLPFNDGDSWAHIVQIKDKLIEHIEKNAPVADVVEVVRCKDCKYWTRDGNGYCDDESYCNNPDGLDNYAKPGDYCSYGERKDGADNAAD